MESALEQKMKSFITDFTIKDLRRKLKAGKTIRDFQLYLPDAQNQTGETFLVRIPSLFKFDFPTEMSNNQNTDQIFSFDFSTAPACSDSCVESFANFVQSQILLGSGSSLVGYSISRF